MHVTWNILCFVRPLIGIQASPPQKPEKKETPVPAQLSPLQGQSVLSFSPSGTASTSTKFSPSCVPGYSPSLSSPSTPNSTGTPFSQSVAFGKVCSEPLHVYWMNFHRRLSASPWTRTIKWRLFYCPPFFRCWTTVRPLVPTPAALDQQKAPVWEQDTAHPLQCWIPLEAKRTIWKT